MTLIQFKVIGLTQVKVIGRWVEKLKYLSKIQ